MTLSIPVALSRARWSQLAPAATKVLECHRLGPNFGTYLPDIFLKFFFNSVSNKTALF
jgi:hypothetical protein